MNLFKINRIVSKYKALRDSDGRKKVIRYGVFSIVSSLLLVASVAGFSFGLSILSDSSVFLGVLVLALGAAFSLATLSHAALYVVFQLALNKRVIGFVSLVALLCAIIASVFVLNTLLCDSVLILKKEITLI